MQLDRRLLVAAGLGLSAAAASSASAETRQRPSGQRLPSSAQPASPAQPSIAPGSGRDETDRLQHIIDAAAAGGRMVTLPVGRFIVRSLKLPHGIQISGAGPATTLQHLGGAPLFVIDNASDVAIADMTLTGAFPMTGEARGLVEARRAQRLTIERIAIEAATRNGIYLERSSGRITGCRVTGAAKAGIFTLDSQGGVEISHNELDGIANNAILVWRSEKGEDGSIVAFNRISRISASDGGTGENGNGINVFRAGSVHVTSNRITDCSFSAVRANSASNVQITANNISRMGEVAIFVEFAFEGAVVASNLIDGASTGISVTNFDHGGRLGSISGNVIRNIRQRPGEPTTSGYGIAVEADASVTGNTIENVETAGLSIGWGRFCRDIAATGNVIRNATIGIAVTDDASAGAVVLTGNVISGAKRGAIRRADHGVPRGPDLAAEVAPSRGRLTISGNFAS